MVIAIGAVIAGIHIIDRVDGCTGSDLTLDVAVAPEMAPAVDAIATDFNAGEHTADDECVHVDVRQVDPANVAFGITGSGATMGDTDSDDGIPASAVGPRLVQGRA